MKVTKCRSQIRKGYVPNTSHESPCCTGTRSRLTVCLIFTAFSTVWQSIILQAATLSTLWYRGQRLLNFTLRPLSLPSTYVEPGRYISRTLPESNPVVQALLKRRGPFDSQPDSLLIKRHCNTNTHTHTFPRLYFPSVIFVSWTPFRLLPKISE